MAIVWIGNARPVKQLEVYLQLAALFSESDYQFHIIGKVPDSHYGKQLLGAIRSASNITYHGSQENDFVNAFLMQAGLLVNTSVSEGFSNTFIQAWMCGTPVLALNSDPDGLLEIHDIGLNCHADKSLLFSGVNKILEPRNYGDMCRNALATANALFATEKNIPKFLTVLEKAKNDRESTRRKA